MSLLYWLYDLTLQLGLKYFQYILTPVGSFREVFIHYDLSYEENGFSSIFGVSKEKYSALHLKDCINENGVAIQNPSMTK